MKYPHPLPPLSSSAQRFVDGLAVTLRPSTCANYKHAIQHLEYWAGLNQFDIATMTRDDAVSFVKSLAKKRLSPFCRRNYLRCARMYLRHLAERGELEAHPDSLIRPADIPRLPFKLPRALQPDVDMELCRRLRESEDRICRALLLMRNTGIRIGELRTLAYECIHFDGQYRYLKVPLGKMNSERLVPLDDETFEILQWLRRPKARVWLLQGKSGTPLTYGVFQNRLREIAHDLQEKEPDPITTHRLRHTYAVSLLNAGMSIAGIQQLLGHRSLAMTLFYTTVQLKDLTQAYFRALESTRPRYAEPPVGFPDQPDRAHILLSDLARQIHRDAADRSKATRARAHRLARSLIKIAGELRGLGI